MWNPFSLFSYKFFYTKNFIYVGSTFWFSKPVAFLETSFSKMLRVKSGIHIWTSRKEKNNIPSCFPEEFESSILMLPYCLSLRKNNSIGVGVCGSVNYYAKFCVPCWRAYFLALDALRSQVLSHARFGILQVITQMLRFLPSTPET